MKIVVADDDPVSAAVVKRLLLGLGHQVEVVADGLAAWRAVRESRPSVVVSDCIMPRLTGIELCRRIRNLPRSEYIYVILLTAQGEIEDRLLAMASGADDFMSKPLDLPMLAARLATAERVLSSRVSV